MHVNFFAIGLLVLGMALFARVWVPWGEPVAGNIVRRETLSVLGRLRMHGPPAAILYLAAIALLVVGRIGLLTVLVVTGLLALLLALPVRYIMTSQGIRAAWTPFRRWTEFGGVARRRGGVRL